MTPTIAALILILIALVVAWFRVAITGGSIRKRWWPLVIAVFLAWNLLVPLLVRSATYHGKVIDEETGQPIAGAVIAVIWYHSQILHMAETRSFQNASETVTDKDGGFSLWTWPGVSLNPFTYVLTPPDTIIYKAGYAPLSYPTSYERGYATSEGLARDLQSGIVMKLPKLKTREEARRFTDVGSLSVIGVRSDRLPKLFHEVNAQRRALGLMSPIY
jgi:hypothetical protein